MKMTGVFCVLICGALICACTTGVKNFAQVGEEKPKKVEISGALGTQTNPVRCDMPQGQRAYLQRLRDANGRPPSFQRVGSYGPGPYGSILDGYEVVAGTNTVMVFMDMYHPGFIETNALPGFTIVNK